MSVSVETRESQSQALQGPGDRREFVKSQGEPIKTGAKTGAGYSGKSTGPVSYGWFSLGMGKGIKWVLWSSNVTLQRQEKQGDRWLTTEELHLAPKVLKEIVWRLPGWLETIEKNNGGRKFGSK